MRVAILADDLTGAGDTAVQFAEAGWPAFLQRSPQPPDLPDVAVVARALNTRALPDDLAARRTGDAVEVQLNAGVTRLYVKSTRRCEAASRLSSRVLSGPGGRVTPAPSSCSARHTRRWGGRSRRAGCG